MSPQCDTFYIAALASEQTVNTMPGNTLLASGAHGSVGDLMPADGGDAEEVLLELAAGRVDVDALAGRLQSEGAASFVESWEGLIAAIESKASLVTSEP